jgi:hypothetical protein
MSNKADALLRWYSVVLDPKERVCRVCNKKLGRYVWNQTAKYSINGWELHCPWCKSLISYASGVRIEC